MTLSGTPSCARSSAWACRSWRGSRPRRRQNGGGQGNRAAWRQTCRLPHGRSSLWHQDLREGSAPEAFLFDDVQLQMLSQLGEGAAPRADRNRDGCQLILVDEAKACQRLGEIRAAVDQDRPFVVPSLEVRDLRGQVAAEDLGRSPFGLLQRAGEDSLGLLVHRGCDRPVGRGPVWTHGLVAAAAHRVDAGLLERAAVPLTRVVAEPFEHPFVVSVRVGGKPVEGHANLETPFLSLMPVETYPLA